MANGDNGAGYVTGGGSNPDFQGNYIEQGFKVDFLVSIVNDATVSAKRKLEIMKARRSSISIADMFDMQMLMNHLAQLSEMSTSVVSASNSAIQSMARNVKG
ncbi:MAG: DUF5407 domain-containing protein [Parachlamydia sp.]|jgi:hypothetical protein|nr:DUF5407 domain-containing protein [Parachlamydia sp.]